jgi:glycosyltransferase involved in cell wall biosynthesis
VGDPTTVLHLINTGGPGGAEQVFVNLIRELDRTRWRSIAVVPDGGWIYREVKAVGIEPVVLSHRLHTDLPRYLLALSRLIRRHEVTLIHSHLFGPAFVASLLGLLHGIPVIGTLHGEIDLQPHERLRAAKFALVNHGATRIVFVSEALRRFFLDSGALREAITTVIPNGIDSTAFNCPADRTLRGEFGAPADEFLVGAVGNLRAVKGYDVFLRAAALLKARTSGYRFVVVGRADGAEAEDVRLLRNQLGLETDVVFAGFRDDVLRCLAALDLYALTSLNEGFSLSLVEAMAAGLPVVATRCGGPEEIINHAVTGHLVENGSPTSVADSIERLRANPGERRRLGNAARVSVSERFTLDTQVRAYEQLYNDCLLDSRRGWRRLLPGRKRSFRRSAV